MRSLISIGLFLFSLYACADELKKTHCDNWFFPLSAVCRGWDILWREGDTDLIFTGYAWHNRSKYSHAKIKSYNEIAWGGGLGKSIYDKYGDWHSLYAVAFSDSHKDVEPMAGYMYLKMFSLMENVKIGIGASVFITAKQNLLDYRPFPAALPWAALVYKNMALHATYIPGSKDIGNVLFVAGRYTFPNT